jgi:glycoprotein endo-alpha-1,2-mannosidase
MWAAAVDAAPFAVSITSYNEWGEGTQIEAAVAHTSAAGVTYQGYEPQEPDLYLRLTEQWARDVRERCGSRLAPAGAEEAAAEEEEERKLAIEL